MSSLRLDQPFDRHFLSDLVGEDLVLYGVTGSSFGDVVGFSDPVGAQACVSSWIARTPGGIHIECCGRHHYYTSHHHHFYGFSRPQGVWTLGLEED